MQKHWRYGNAEYKAKLGATKAWRRRQTWKRKADLEEEHLNHPSAKTGDRKKLLLHIEQLLEILDRRFELNGRRRVRELRFTQYMRKQKAMHDVRERILHGGGFEDDERLTVIAHGDAIFTTKGRFPGPLKTIRRELQKRKE